MRDIGHMELQPNAFKPFDEVLVRDSDSDKWIPAHFARFNERNADCKFEVLDGGSLIGFKQCISYKGNERLAFTAKPLEEEPAEKAGQRPEQHGSEQPPLLHQLLNSLKEHRFNKYDDVLVSDFEDFRWGRATFIGYTAHATDKYEIIGGSCWPFCVPFKGNESLEGTSDPAPELANVDLPDGVPVIEFSDKPPTEPGLYAYIYSIKRMGFDEPNFVKVYFNRNKRLMAVDVSDLNRDDCAPVEEFECELWSTKPICLVYNRTILNK